MPEVPRVRVAAQPLEHRRASSGCDATRAGATRTGDEHGHGENVSALPSRKRSLRRTRGAGAEGAMPTARSTGPKPMPMRAVGERGDPPDANSQNRNGEEERPGWRFRSPRCTPNEATASPVMPAHHDVGVPSDEVQGEQQRPHHVELLDRERPRGGGGRPPPLRRGSPSTGWRTRCCSQIETADADRVLRA